MQIGRKLKVGIVGAGVAAIVAVPTAFAMQGEDRSDSAPSPAVEEPQEKAEQLQSAQEEIDDGIGIGEEIEFLNELSDAIAEALAEAGIAHTVQPAEVRVVVFNEDDEAAWEIVDGVLEELFDDYSDDFDPEDLDDEEIEELRAEAQVVRDALDAAGIPYEIEVDDLGIESPLFDEDDEAAWEVVDAALDAFWAELDAEYLAGLSEEELQEYRDEAAAVRAALDAAASRKTSRMTVSASAGHSSTRRMTRPGTLWTPPSTSSGTPSRTRTTGPSTTRPESRLRSDACGVPAGRCGCGSGRPAPGSGARSPGSDRAPRSRNWCWPGPRPGQHRRAGWRGA